MTVRARFRPVLRATSRPALTALLTSLAAAALLAAPDAPSEVRALWVARASLTSPESIARMVSQAQAGRLNTLLVQVRGRGDAYFRGGIEPRASALAGQPASFDPLALVLKLARPRRIRVHAWINVGLVSGASDLPSSPAHLVHRHPEWLMVPRALGRDLALASPASRSYLDRLARWTRSQPGDIEGLYVSPVPDDAAAMTASVVADIVARYAVDGVHLDYVRYPGEDFDYSRNALLAFRRDVAGMLSGPDLRRREKTLGGDLVAWTETFPERWAEFRRERLTALVRRISDRVRARRPGTVVSAAVVPDPTEASSRRLQDWQRWLRGGLIDVVCPMAYATDAAGFASQVAAAREAAGASPLWAGIGAYRLTASQTIENIETARKLGVEGVVLFSYDSLVAAPRGGDYLSQVARAAFSR